MGEKRKRETTEINVESYVDEPVSAVASFFNGLSVPDIPFDLYKNKQDSFVVHGETDKLEYNGSTVTDEQNDYVVGVYDPVTRSVELYKAPFIQAKVTPISKRKYDGPRVKQLGKLNMEQRNALGQAFGTKKAKQTITNLQKNKIDSEKLQDVEMDIVDTVKDATTALPTKEQMAATVLSDRPTPLADVSATNVEAVYPIHNIIPQRELDAIRVNAIQSALDENARLALLPYSQSAYIRRELERALTNTDKLQLVYYASLLFGVYNNRRVRDKQTLMDRLGQPAETLVDGVLERFAVGKASQFGKSKDRSFTIDPHHEDKLLCYLLALIMHINDFLVELPPLANELNMKPTRLVSLFRALGATIKSLTLAQADAFGIPRSQASSYKVASLKVPFTLPEMMRRGGGRK